MCEGRDEKESLTEEMMNTCGYTVRGITNRKAVKTLHMTLTSSHLLSVRIYAQSLISVCSIVAKWCFPGSYLQSLEWEKKIWRGWQLQFPVVQQRQNLNSVSLSHMEVVLRAQFPKGVMFCDCEDSSAITVNNNQWGVIFTFDHSATG